MRKRFVKVMFWGVLACASASVVVSCKDYDDDIDRIENEIGQINQTIEELRAAVGNNGVKSVSYDAATGTLTIVDANDKSLTCTIRPNMPEYTVAVEDGKVVLKKDGVEVSSGELPEPEKVAGFDPAKLTVNDAGEVLYDGVPTGVKVPTSSIAVIEKDGEVVGYKFTIDGKEYPFYIADALPLTSLVFRPEAYLDGIEAMRATNLSYDKWTLASNKVTDKGEIWNAPATPASASNITPEMVAYYHVNPAGVTMKQIKRLVLTADDKDYVSTRSTDFKIDDIDLEKCSIENGLLKVVFDGNSEAIQKLGANKVTVLNLQATVEANGEEKTVTSDYAAIYKSVLKDFVLANAKAEGAHKSHHYGADNARGLVGKAEDAIKAEPICEVAYNNKEGIDLSAYVETHYKEYLDKDGATSDEEGTIANDRLADYGLKLAYALSDYYQGDNQTLQSSFFANLNGSVLTAKVGDVTEDPIAAVGRMPLVRVELQNAANGEVLNVGWIKVKITRGETAGLNYDKTCGDLKLQCSPETYRLTFDEMNLNIYQKLMLTKEDFHAIYELKKTGAQDAEGNDIAEIKAGEYGQIVELNDADPLRETVCLAWTVTDVDQLRAVKDNGGKMIATATFAPKNDPSRGDVTITFTATVKTPSASFDDGSKLSEYWFDNMTSIRMNTVVPGVSPDDCSFVVDVNNVFEGNKPLFKLNGEASEDFALDKISYQYIFAAENNGMKVQGNDGKIYTLAVSADGKTLSAAGQPVAVIEGTSVAYQENAVAEAILNISAHDEKPFTAKLHMVLTNECGMELPMTDGKFDAKFLRPVDVFANEGKYFVDATDNGSTVKMLDLVWLADWRDYKFSEHADYYTYYEVESIVADIANITTNMNGNDIENKKLSEVTKNIVITQKDANVAGNYGSITYVNNGSNVQPFKLKIPVTVNYKWGSVKTAVYMDVKRTEGN